MQSAVLGLDIGTTSISCVAVNVAGRLLGAVSEPHNAAIPNASPQRCEQNPHQLRETAASAVRQLVTSLSNVQIEAIGVTGQMHSTVLLDCSSQLLGNIITWQDKRSLLPGASGRTILQELTDSVTAEMMEPTGCRLSPGYLGTTLYALRQLEELPDSLARVTFVADWVTETLCETTGNTDRSNAASSGLYNLATDRWQSELLDAAGVRLSWLPTVADSTAVVGCLSSAAAADFGLQQGTPICNAIGDNQAAVISSLPDDGESVLINIGTGGQIVWRTDGFARVSAMDTRYLPNSHDDPAFMLVGAGLCGGDAYAWVNRTIRQWLSAFGCLRSEQEVWEQLANQIDSCDAATASGLSCEPFFTGTRPDPDRRAVFRGVSTHNFTPAAVAGCVLQGIAQSMFDVYDAAGNHRPENLRRIVMSGNGSRRNPLLVNAVEQRFRVPVSVSPFQEEAAAGAAMNAGVSARMWSDYSEVRQLLQDAASRF